MAQSLSPKPPAAVHPRLSGPARWLIGLGLVPATLFTALIVLRSLGLARPFLVPTAAMAPAISPGDHVFMEGLTYLRRPPRRGEVIVFETEGIATLPQDQLFVMRATGEPREQVGISAGDLYIDGKVVTLSNAMGRITYALPSRSVLFDAQTNTSVPAGHYFVLGDNSTNSLDSRYWGCVPRRNIRGRISFCYWPPQRMGFVK